MFAACGSVDCHVGLRPPRNDEGESAMTATPLSRALFFTPSIARFRRYRGDPRSLEDQRPPEGSNAAQGFFWRRRKPAQRREFGAKPDMLCVFSRPGNAIGVVISAHCHVPACRLPLALAAPARLSLDR